MSTAVRRRVHAPSVDLTKAQIILAGVAAGLDLQHYGVLAS